MSSSLSLSSLPISCHRLLDLADLTEAASLPPADLADNVASFRIRPLNWATISIHSVFRVDDDVQVVAFNYGNDLVVAFHSNTPADRIDLRPEPFIEMGGQTAAPAVAAGVLREWRLVSMPVTRCIVSWLAAHDLGRVYVTGHGVGAGLSSLQAVLLNSPGRVSNVTFGAMRAFSSAFRAEFDGRVSLSLRIVNGADDVPTMAIWNGAWPSHLHQVGNVAWFVDGQVRTSYLHKSKQMVSGQFRHGDHAMGQYRETIALWSQA